MNNKPKWVIAFLFIAVSLTLLLAAFATPSWADIIFTNFGQGQSPGAWSIRGMASIPANPVPEMIAASFTSGGNFTLADVQLPLVIDIGNTGPNSFNIFLTTSIAGQPGTVLESWNVAAAPFLPIGPVGSQAQTVPSALHPALTSATQYWLVVGPGNTLTQGAWAQAPSDLATATNFLLNDTPNSLGIPDVTGPWHSCCELPRTAFQIDGIGGMPVPEPSTWLLLGSGLIILILWKKRMIYVQ